jgi:short-subunit dehydrogenase involved in D-alanine esterification of teichoic acids
MENEIATKYGYLAVLVNNAGINYDTCETVDSAEINGTVMQTITTNLLGPWRVCQAFLPLLRKSRAARIVNVSSELCRFAFLVAGWRRESKVRHASQNLSGYSIRSRDEPISSSQLP